MIGIICANGNVLPPMLVFPIVRYDAARMMHGVSDAAKGLAYPSDWMTNLNFNKKVVLIMDNHEWNIK